MKVKNYLFRYAGFYAANELRLKISLSYALRQDQRFPNIYDNCTLKIGYISRNLYVYNYNSTSIKKKKVKIILYKMF